MRLVESRVFYFTTGDGHCELYEAKSTAKLSMYTVIPRCHNDVIVPRPPVANSLSFSLSPVRGLSGSVSSGSESESSSEGGREEGGREGGWREREGGREGEREGGRERRREEGMEREGGMREGGGREGNRRKDGDDGILNRKELVHRKTRVRIPKTMYFPPLLPHLSSFLPSFPTSLPPSLPPSLRRRPISPHLPPLTQLQVLDGAGLCQLESSHPTLSLHLVESSQVVDLGGTVRDDKVGCIDRVNEGASKVDGPSARVRHFLLGPRKEGRGGEGRGEEGRGGRGGKLQWVWSVQYMVV